ncbi:unannotated protein [freshwater metagenome]|uniref:Unannotated protein n=1 Tax=freshwater metagenome TaxID=449393 RepID=A0A6J6VCE3_9ZZZZ
MLGTVLATEYVSPNTPKPMAATMAISRTIPVSRDAMVPTAIAAEDCARLGSSLAGTGRSDSESSGSGSGCSCGSGSGSGSGSRF